MGRVLRTSTLTALATLAPVFAALLFAEDVDAADSTRNDMQAIVPKTVEASSAEDAHPARGAVDGNRFSTRPEKYWKGTASEKSWHWQADFGRLTDIGSILQVLGDDESILAGAPMAYTWQVSDDGTNWRDLKETSVSNEQRMYRIHRLEQPARGRYLRMSITSTSGTPPAIREIEIYPQIDQKIQFPDWVFAIGSEDRPRIDNCRRFVDLARQCEGYADLHGQYVWHGYFGLQVALAEPRPMCVFYTGSYRDWCEVIPNFARHAGIAGRRFAADVGGLRWRPGVWIAVRTWMRSRMGLPEVPRSGASEVADLRPYRIARSSPEKVLRRLYQQHLRTRPDECTKAR